MKETAIKKKLGRPKKDEAKSITVYGRVKKTVYESLRKKAEEDRRSMSDLISILLEDSVTPRSKDRLA